ncbi:iron-sulfur cluster assembly accessory protein [Methylacidiphilum caldifontis]|uniref:HesB/IscA family protein n=1 Tax=Methylacidiphilum caldifontis TaxID=2795386 RepID=UPI001A9004C7|nr:iron-sulfur cluster assembly accessory protein [Methylacidiphilum caldifontis]QSR89472.1 iron-sulfur cluster assembly accessory protein [Methylacidiphilum caldifontis]
MAIMITQRAQEKLAKSLQGKKEAVGLRLAVLRSGCAGYSYHLNYARQVEADDFVCTFPGGKLVVDQDSLKMLEGLVLDYVKDSFRERFVFNNPNATGSCGCGESFSVGKSLQVKKTKL